MKFIHCADFHLGAVQHAARLAALDQVLGVCDAQQVQLLLVAGDLFDKPVVQPRQAEQVFARFAQRPGLCVFIAAGNHDPIGPGTVYDRALPGNVYVFGSAWSCAQVEEYGVRVWGISSVGGKPDAPLHTARGSLAQQAGMVEVGLVHGCLTTKGAACDYRALVPEQIAASGLAYLALGHIHKAGELAQAGGTMYGYCGSPLRLGADEVQAKGVYLGRVENGVVRTQFVALVPEMAQHTVQVTGLSQDQVMQRVLALAAQEAAACVVLEGEMSASSLAFVQAQLAALQQRSPDLRLVFAVQQQLDAASIARESTLRGSFARHMLDQLAALVAQGAPQQEIAAHELALGYGLRAFEGEVTSER